MTFEKQMWEFVAAVDEIRNRWLHEMLGWRPWISIKDEREFANAQDAYDKARKDIEKCV
jgi:hypothetical protein